MKLDISSILTHNAPPSEAQAHVRLFSKTSRLSLQLKEQLFLQLKQYLTAGLDFPASIAFVEMQAPPVLKDALKSILESLRQGQKLSEAFNKTMLFTPYEIQLLSVAEETGNATLVLHKLAAMKRKKRELIKVLISATAYPILLLFTSLVVVVFMLSVVVPMFTEVFARFGKELPFLTRAIISSSAIVSGALPFLVGTVIAATTASMFFYRSHPAFRLLCCKTLLAIPLVGKATVTVLLARFYFSMQVMLQSGVNLLPALKLFSTSCRFLPFQLALQKAERILVEGGTIKSSFSGSAFFDTGTLAILSVGEETGSLAEAFRNLEEQASQKLSHQGTLLGALLEPVIILGVGAIIALILVSMYLPLFEITSTINN